MAICSVSVRPLQRTKGHSASGLGAYMLDVNLTDPYTGIRHTQIGRHDHEHGGEPIDVVAAYPGAADGAPDFFATPADAFMAADNCEKRKDAALGYEVELALPHELNRKQQMQLMRDYAQSISDRDGRYCLGARHPKAGNQNAHIFISARPIGRDEKGAVQWGKKVNDEVSNKRHLAFLREQWARVTNLALERAGHDVRIDHRSNEARGLGPAYKHEGKAPSVEVLEYNARIAADRAAALERERAAAEREEKHYAELARHTALYQAQIERDEADRQGEERMLEIERAAAEKRRGGLADRIAAAEAKNAPLPTFGKREIFEPSREAPGTKKRSMADRMLAAEDGAKKDHRARAAEQGFFGKRRGAGFTDRSPLDGPPQPKAPEPDFGPR